MLVPQHPILLHNHMIVMLNESNLPVYTCNDSDQNKLAQSDTMYYTTPHSDSCSKTTENRSITYHAHRELKLTKWYRDQRAEIEKRLVETLAEMIGELLHPVITSCKGWFVGHVPPFLKLYITHFVDYTASDTHIIICWPPVNQRQSKH